MRQFISILLCALLAFVSCRKGSAWQQLDAGLHVAKLVTPGPLPLQGFTLFIIKIDPHIYEFELLCASELDCPPMTTQQWAEKHNLLGAINAGMYQTDLRSNVGFMKNFAHFNNNHLNSSHKSLAVFNPKSPYDPHFYIYDLDEINPDSVLELYNTAIQNLRLIKRPGENRWHKQNDKWSEAALAQDADGNVLFIYCRRPISMFDFNQALLRLPVHIVCAQHLDGGPHASLFFAHNGAVHNYAGAISITQEAEDIIQGVLVPNVIGFRKRGENTSRKPD